MKTVFWLALSAALIFCVLALPNHPGTMKWTALTRFPLELPVLVLGVLAVRAGPVIRGLLAMLLLATVVLKLADYGMFTAYNRTFNPILDTFLINAGIGLLSDSIGTTRAYLAIAGVVLAALVVLVLLFKALGVWASVSVPRFGRMIAGAGAVVFAGWTVADAGHVLKYWEFERNPPGTAWTSRLTFRRAVQMQDTAAELVIFRQEAAQDPYAEAVGLFDLIADRDVIVIYIESYGRASFDNPLYTDTHLATLADAQAPLAQAGFAMRSGWLTSPTAGGQSWLAHGTLSSGLWTSDNGRYTAMLASGRQTLFHLASEAGFRTAAFMPAITLGWPESSVMGFEHIFAAADIPYRGARFNWVTMPDQFTLATYDTLLPDDPGPNFIQIALISSHAPWVPVPDMVPWDDVGDGTVFNEMAARGPTPRELWRDRDDVRDQYRLAIDYSLRATMSHIARLWDDAPLVMVIGDHQAAGFVAGNDNRDVPIHMIGPPAALDLFEDWGWTPGLIPVTDAPVWRMDAFRDRFISAVSSGVDANGAVP